MRSVWAKIAVFSLGALFLVLALRGLDVQELGAQLRGVRPLPLIVSFALGSIALLLRSLRWRLLLSCSAPVSILSAFWINATGQLINSVLPARIGDAHRVNRMAQEGGFNHGSTAGAVVVDRLLDASVLVLCATLAFLWLPDTPSWLLRSLGLVAGAVVLSLATLSLAPTAEGAIKRQLLRVPLTGKFAQLPLLIAHFFASLRLMLRPGTLARFAVFSASAWLLDAWGMVMVGASIGVDLSVAVAMCLLCAVAFATAAPSAPGGIGVVQFVAVIILGKFAISRESAVAISVVGQAVTVGMLCFWGLAGLRMQFGVPGNQPELQRRVQDLPVAHPNQV